ncbi:MAG: TauC [Firmicutes bacterium]|nr:TauC [Bacillota bacterium]
MEAIKDKISVCTAGNLSVMDKPDNSGIEKQKFLHRLGVAIAFLGIWQLASIHYHSNLLLPPPVKTAQRLLMILQDLDVLKNLAITLSRVLTGFLYAIVIGVPLGFLMGYSQKAMQALDPLVGSIRQVPIMAWIPLTIVWFGLGDGPTIFLIAISGVFPLILNTIAGVRGISQDYYHAARSMGAGAWSIFAHVIVPGSLPDILTGARLALGSGWMSVICAEFIATSAGFGYSMVEAQTRMETDKLLALMVMGALVGYVLDRVLQELNKSLVAWRFSKQ